MSDEGRIAELEDEIDELNSELEDVRRDLADAKQENEILKEKIGRARTDLNEVLRDLDI